MPEAPLIAIVDDDKSIRAATQDLLKAVRSQSHKRATLSQSLRPLSGAPIAVSDCTAGMYFLTMVRRASCA